MYCCLREIELRYACFKNGGYGAIRSYVFFRGSLQLKRIFTYVWKGEGRGLFDYNFDSTPRRPLLCSLLSSQITIFAEVGASLCSLIAFSQITIFAEASLPKPCDLR